MALKVDLEARRAVAAAVVGNVLEWYDFAVYAYMATVIAAKFFPASDEVTSLLSTFAAFGIGFVARPLGGILIGRLGDVRGRKTALLFTIALMAAGTVAIGLVPTYQTIGVAAPIFVVAARLVQGFSAGGEWGGSTAFIVEWAPPGRRGLYGSLQQCSVAGGLLLGSGVAALVNTFLPAAAVDSWGWRIPFLLGGLLGPVGLYMRKHIDETPAFRRSRQEAGALLPGVGPGSAPSSAPEPPIAPIWLAARAFGFTVLWTVSYYIVLTLHADVSAEAGRRRAQPGVVGNRRGAADAGRGDAADGPSVRSRGPQAFAARRVHRIARAALSAVQTDAVRSAVGHDLSDPACAGLRHRGVFRSWPCRHRRDLPDACAIDLDVHRL